MKILDLYSYNEKLKIRPININNMSYVKPCFTKSDLRTFDVVLIHGLKYMTFLNDDFSKISDIYDNLPNIEEGIFFYYMRSSLCPTNFMKIKSYDEDLSINETPSYNITDVWRKIDFMYRINRIEMITQEFMNDILLNNFQHIQIQHK